ncbi:MAG: methyltransferase domain-containing protein [Deltaproteobacteria bacterium]|nr:methyltransferase domain-containing protein [Deltaproteobacteria bacterium]
MKHTLLPLLACPACGGYPLALAVSRATRETAWSAHVSGDAPGYDRKARTMEDVLEGTLTCEACGRTYPVSNGIPRLLTDPDRAPPASAHAWTTFDKAERVWEEAFLDVIQPLEPADFLGRTALDAGAGFGRNALFAARYGAEVVALDESPEAVDAARRNLAGLFSAHVVQGDVTAPPFREGAFDLVFCLGVLHHLREPRPAFDRLGRLLPSGGRLSVWVYGPRQGFTALANRALRSLTTQMEPRQLHRVSRGIALGLRVFSHTPTRYLEPIPVLRGVVHHLPVHDHHRWPFPVVVADVYDRLRIPVTHTFTGETVEKWFEDQGFVDIVVTRRVRNNESFRGTGVRR